MTQQVNTSVPETAEKTDPVSYFLLEEEPIDNSEQVTVRLLFAVLLFLLKLVVLEGEYGNIALAVAYVVAGYDVIIDAYEHIIKGRLNRSSVIISLATLPCFYIGRNIDAVVVMCLYRFGQMICKDYIYNLKQKNNVRSAPFKIVAHWHKDDQTIDIGNDKIAPGMLLQVGNNERIPTDAILHEGETIISTTGINNKTDSVEVHKGDVIIGGCINVGNPVIVKAIRTLDDATISKINDVVSECEMSHSHYEEIITRFFRYFTPTLILIAVGYAVLGPTMMYTTYQRSIFASCCLLAVSYPLSLLLAVPLAFYCGSSKAGRNGVLVKGARYLELLNDFDYLVLDKTDTLKTSKLVVREIKTEMDENEFMTIVTAIESNSNHELAKAICKNQNIQFDASKVRNFTVEPGLGVSAKYGRKQYHIGNLRYMKQLKVKNLDETLENAVYVADRENYLGAILFEDNSLEDAIKDINDLKKMEVNNIALFSSDSTEQLETYKKIYSLSAIFGDMTEQDKIDKIVLFKRQGRHVAYVGDCEKDKAILDTANLSISMGIRNSSAAFHHSNVILMYESLEGLVKGRRIARRTCRNVNWTILFNVMLKIVLVMMGFIEMIPLWLIYALDLIATLLSVFNSAKLVK